MNPRIKNVRTSPDYKLHMEFTNEEDGIYDCLPILDFGVFKELKDLSYFNLAQVLDGTVVWSHDQDICPDTLYLVSIKCTVKGAPTEARAL